MLRDDRSAYSHILRTLWCHNDARLFLFTSYLHYWLLLLLIRQWLRAVEEFNALQKQKKKKKMGEENNLNVIFVLKTNLSKWNIHIYQKHKNWIEKISMAVLKIYTLRFREGFFLAFFLVLKIVLFIYVTFICVTFNSSHKFNYLWTLWTFVGALLIDLFSIWLIYITNQLITSLCSFHTQFVMKNANYHFRNLRDMTKNLSWHSIGIHS